IASRLSGRRRGGRVLRRAREVADRPRKGMTTEIGQGVSVTKTGEQGAFGGELLTVNFGPHHPSTHGVLRLIVDLDGEQVRKLTTVIGSLQPEIEKQADTLHCQSYMA